MDVSIKMIFYIVILVLLFVAYYQLFRSIVLKDKIRKNMDVIYSKLATKDKKRISDIEKERREYGTVGGKNGNFLNKALDKLDSLLIYSGWAARYTWLNTSTLIVLIVIAMCFSFLALLLVSGNIVLSVISMMIVAALPVVRMSMLADSAYRSTEKQLTLCINIVSNVSASTNNIVSVLQEVAPYMAYPLNGAMERAISSANLTGNDSVCVRQLCREIEHPLFVRFIRHLEICSKNDSDFKTVAKDYRSQVDTELRNARRLRALFVNGRGNMSALLVISMAMICMMAMYTDGDVVSMLVDMSHSMLGAVVLIFTGAIYLIAILYMLLGMRR